MENRTKYFVEVTYADGKKKKLGGTHVNEPGTPENIERHLMKHKSGYPGAVSFKVTIPEDPDAVQATGKAAEALALISTQQ